jgi:hypothetical protein
VAQVFATYRYVWPAEVQLFAADVEALTAAVAAQAAKPGGLLVRTVSLR